MSQRLVFLKLGGSLITDKNQAHTARLDVLERMAFEIAAARAQDQDLKIVLGHGSGSFGHYLPANIKLARG
jgi:isopentenyl phosphate kinase